jgi:eukaryotic-like serine/threonine-protein kinase
LSLGISEHQDLMKVGQRVERYVVDGVIGQGGMAVVYKVRHTQLDSEHALKQLRASSPAIRRRLLQEGKVQAALRHPNLVNVTDVVDTDGGPGLIMEFVDGPSLDIYLLREDRLPPGDIDALARGILSGVAEAHSRGVIHRDIKPANVIVARTSDGLVPKVMDFGLTKVLSAEESGGLSTTRTGMRMGSPRYMSPEQIRDAKNVDARADVFALGAVLYELVTGRKAFPGDDIIEIFQDIAAGRFEDPAIGQPDLPDRWLLAIRGALVPDRRSRIVGARALLEVWNGSTAGAAAVPPAVVVPAAPAPLPPETPPKRRTLLLAVLGGLPALTLMAGVLYWMNFTGSEEPREPVVAAPVAEPAPVAATEPALTPTPTATPTAVVAAAAPGQPKTPKPAARPATSKKKASKTAPPETAPPEAEVAPPPEAAVDAAAAPADVPMTDRGVVRVTGDAEEVWLVANGQRMLPGGVPPGRYDVEMVFKGVKAMRAGEVVVKVGEVVEIQCYADLKACY